ncbi:MAG: EAL domain-containing protein [Polyangiales bacterium]
MHDGVNTESATALLIDDDPAVLRSYARVLRGAGFAVETLSEGANVTARLAESDFDLVISDVSLPDVNGVSVLKAAREFDPELPVVLITGAGDLESAMRAVEYGALRYLLKPVHPALLAQTAQEALAQRRAARLRRRAFELYGAEAREAPEQNSLASHFDRAVEGLTVVYQPIVWWSARSTFAHEALVRSAGPELCRPDQLFAAAEHLGRVHELGRAIRARVAEDLARPGAPDCVFVNLHPCDLEDDELGSPASPLSRVASRVVLEVTERSTLDAVGDLNGRLAALRALGFRVAIDDLGAGYSGLASFVQLRPEVVKLDMALVRGVEVDPTRQKIIRAMVSLCYDLGISVVAEGVETEAERATVVELGCDLLQGYLFAKPSPPFCAVEWERFG